MIQTENLTKQFGNFTAVQELTLNIPQGEVFALLGPNGAGKTTTVRMLACLIEPTSGSATVAGQDVRESADQIRSRVGVLTEAPGLYEQMSAWKNLMFFAHLYGVPNAAAQVERYLKLLELWDHRDRPAGGLSKGMKQKVAIARALLHEPDLLFLDEPTSGLDPSAAKTVRDFLEQLKASGRTILLTTHNLNEAERLADRIGVINQRLIAVDTADNLRHRLFGRRTLIRLSESVASLAEQVRMLEGIQGAQWRDSTLVVDLDDPDRRNPAVVAAIVGAGGQVRAVEEERASLEEVYLGLIEEEQP